MRLCFINISLWAPPSLGMDFVLTRLQCVHDLLERLNIDFCSLGEFTDERYFYVIPLILERFNRFSCSCGFHSDAKSDVCPSYESCLQAAKVMLDIHSRCGDLGNFRFCCSFNGAPGTAFFPVAFHDGQAQYSVSVGLENADLLFLAFFGSDSYDEGLESLKTVLVDTLRPIEAIVQATCTSFSVSRGVDVAYNGIDASINPGLSLPDSVGAGIEALIFPRPQQFGSFGTLPVVSVITKAIKSVQQSGQVKLCGYCGLMLPVMEDLILSQRALEGRFGLRDLLVFSSVCGVGLDTVPIPASVTADQVAAIYLETGTLSFRLNKPLSCRLLPMTGMLAGDSTDVRSPYLCNSKVFSVC